MKDALLTMLDLQDTMNAKVHPQWREQGNAWHRAIWVECAELMDHYGWKWWKAQTPDSEQVELELIDIWHFGLSIALERGGSLDEIADDIVKQLDLSACEGDFREAVEVFALQTLLTKTFDVPSFSKLMVLADLSFESMYSRYVAKNVLNIFRQDHGYKEGSYIKVWAGQEDNEHLMDILATFDMSQVGIQALLYSSLKQRYQTLVAE